MPRESSREVIEEDQFKEELAKLIKEPRVADEFIDGAKWLLARAPDSGTRLGSSHVWFLPMTRTEEGILPVVLYYTFDDNFVNLLSIVETLYPVE